MSLNSDSSIALENDRHEWSTCFWDLVLSMQKNAAYSSLIRVTVATWYNCYGEVTGMKRVSNVDILLLSEDSLLLSITLPLAVASTAYRDYA